MTEFADLTEPIVTVFCDDPPNSKTDPAVDPTLGLPNCQNTRSNIILSS